MGGVLRPNEWPPDWRERAVSPAETTRICAEIVNGYLREHTHRRLRRGRDLSRAAGLARAAIMQFIADDERLFVVNWCPSLEAIEGMVAAWNDAAFPPSEKCPHDVARMAARPCLRGRNEAIYMRRLDGATLRVIAGEFGISVERVRQICRREKRIQGRRVAEYAPPVGRIMDPDYEVANLPVTESWTPEMQAREFGLA